MSIKTADLSTTKRLLLEQELVPIQGKRFQPTGFPNLGAATFTRPDNTEMLLVESAQSMANRLEATTWDESRKDYVVELTGLPYVKAVSPTGEFVTNSILEAHRINSPYFLEGNDTSFYDTLTEEMAITTETAVNIPVFAQVMFKYDPQSVLHGVFISKKELGGGRLRLQRLLSGFIEAENVRPVESGGVKLDRVNPRGSTNKGFGHVPFHRTEYTAQEIKAYFNFDLVTLRSYGLPDEAQQLLLDLGLWKIRRLLDGELRLRTACDLITQGAVHTTPNNWVLPTEKELVDSIDKGIQNCGPLFSEPRVTSIVWETKK